MNAMEVKISEIQWQMESITLSIKQGQKVIRQRSAQSVEAGNGMKEFLRLIDEVQADVYALGVDDELLLRRIHNLRQGALTDTFKMAVIGDFRSEKRTLIDVLLGQEILSTYTASTFPVIKEIKYGQKPKAVLYFVNPLPEKMYYGIPKILAHMRRFQMKDVPPMEIPVDEIKDYMELSTGGETHRTNPFEKLELFLPSTFLKNGWELIDTIELSESLTNEVRSIECLSKADAAVFVFNAMAMGSAVEMAYIKDTLTLYGLTGERLFCVVNCYDQLGEREQQKVKEFSDNLLAPYTKHIYYSSAYKGLMGHLQNNEVLLQESMIPIIEADLQKAAWEKHNGLKEKIQSELQDIVEEIEKMKAHISNVETISLKNPVDFRTQQLIQTADIDRHIQFIRELTQKYDFPARQKKKIHNELKRIVEKQNDKVLNMAVVGEFSSGKSSFINALLRENLLETDVIQGTTVASTLIRYDAEKTLCVSGEGGRGKKIQKTESAAALAKLLRIYTSGEQKEIDVHHLEVGYPSDFLNQGICIIDTPGTNSLEQWHEDVTKKAIREQADACIVLTSAEKPFPESFCYFLEENLQDVLHTCIFVVTKIDLIPPKQQKKQLEYIQKVIQEKLEIEAPLVLPYSGLPVLNGTCLEYVPLNQKTEQRIVQFLQEQRIKIQLQRCMSLLEQTIGRLQENMNLVSHTRKREHEQLMQALTTDLQTFVSSQKCELRQQFEEDADRRSKEFCDQITKDICSASYQVHAEFRKLPREFDIRQFLQTRLKALLEEKRDEILKKAGMQGNDSNQFRTTMQSIVDIYCAQFEKNFKAEYRQLTLLAHELVNEITIDLNLNDSFLINAQADISIKNKVMANDNKDTRSFYGNMGAGAAAGAAIGSVVPVIGTTAGAIIGGIIGLARWSKKSDDTSKGEEFRKQVSGDVSAMVEQFFSGLKDSMMQTFNRGTTSCWTQIERVMDQYLTQYTSIVNEMRSRDKKAQEAVEQEIQVIQQDMAAAQKRIEQVQSIKLKLNQL